VKVLLQRVSRAEVRVGGQRVAAIGRGLLALVAVEQGDTESTVDFFAGKTVELRIFPDGDKPMHRSVLKDGLEVLAVSQFTLAASTRKGRRPSFLAAAPPEEAERLYRRFVSAIEARGIRVASGVFRATMEVELVNDGPVTVLLDPPGPEGSG
jgi:D-tyrosyl-tRNA(Tyr) deacylase